MYVIECDQCGANIRKPAAEKFDRDGSAYHLCQGCYNNGWRLIARADVDVDGSECRRIAMVIPENRELSSSVAGDDFDTL
jgi:hypothetical protein